MYETKDEKLELMLEAMNAIGKLIQMHTGAPALSFASDEEQKELSVKKA